MVCALWTLAQAPSRGDCSCEYTSLIRALLHLLPPGRKGITVGFPIAATCCSPHPLFAPSPFQSQQSSLSAANNQSLKPPAYPPSSGSPPSPTGTPSTW